MSESVRLESVGSSYQLASQRKENVGFDHFEKTIYLQHSDYERKIRRPATQGMFYAHHFC